MGEQSKRLIDGQFIVTLIAMACVEAALLTDKIDANVYSVLISLAVGGFLALKGKT
jgi:hypothetical protein